MPYIGKQLVRGQNRELDDISGSFNGSNTVFNLTVAGDSITPGSALQLFISVGGVLQNPNTDFTVAGNQITFSTAPGSGLSFFGILQGDAVDFNTPADGSVTTAKLGSNLTINVADGTAATPSIQFNGSGTDTGFYSPTTDEIGASVAGGEALRIDSSGRLLVGTSSARSNLYNNSSGVAPQIQLEGTSFVTSSMMLVRNSADGNDTSIILGKTRGTSTGANTVVSSGDGIGAISFQGADGSELVEAASIQALIDGTPGANDMPGRLVFSTTADGASSPTERLRITNDGTITTKGSGATSFGTVGLTFYGTAAANGSVDITRSSGQPLALNRLVDDGNLLEFYQDTLIEGSISVSGTTVSYNGAHLSRWSQLLDIDPYDKTVRPKILRGTVMSNLNEMCDWTCPKSGECEDNEQLNKTKISDVEGDKNVAGVFQSWDDDDDTWVNDFYLAMTGDFVIRIAAGITVQRGDLLMSAGDGTAKPQDDDIIRSKTIAKVTSTTVSCTHPDGSYCVPCVLMAC